MNIYKGHRFSSDIISYAVWLYYRFKLRFEQSEKGNLPIPSLGMMLVSALATMRLPEYRQAPFDAIRLLAH